MTFKRERVTPGTAQLIPGHDCVHMPNKKKSTHKIQDERGFLFFLLHNPHPKQTRDFLTRLLRPEQYAVLRELAVNDLAHNLPSYDHPVKKKALIKRHLQRIRSLAQGKLKKHNLHHLLPLLQIWARHSLAHYGLR